MTPRSFLRPGFPVALATALAMGVAIAAGCAPPVADQFDARSADCDEDPSSCTPRAPSCESDADCDGGLCHLADHTCGGLLGDQARCERDAECADFICVQVCSTCVGSCGPAQDDSDCSRDEDCASGTCDLASYRCGAAPVLDRCTRNKDCGSGLCICLTSNACASGVGYCGPLPAGSSCSNDGDCASGICDCADLSCESGRGTCGPVANGNGCTRDADCESGPCACDTVYCQDGQCGVQGAGATCLRDEDCQSGDCDLDRDLGGNCGPFPDGRVCTRDQDCTNANCLAGRCRPKPNGSGCTADDECESSLCESGVCALRQPDGRSCQSDDDCLTGFCDDGSCHRPLPQGLPCTANDQCITGACLSSLCACLGDGTVASSPAECCALADTPTGSALTCNSTPPAACGASDGGCAASCTPNLVVNGSFEEPALDAGTWSLFQSIPGWTLVSGPNMEIDNLVLGTPAEGEQSLELNSAGPSAIATTVATVPGQTYKVQFSLSSRPGTPSAENEVVALWNGTNLLVWTADGTQVSQLQWEYFTFSVVGTGNDTLELASLSPAGSGEGGEVDAVSVWLADAGWPCPALPDDGGLD